MSAVLRLAICDDEQKFCDDICVQVQQILGVETTVQMYTDPVRCLADLRQNLYDIVLLDIDMPELSGMDIAAALQEQEQKPILIFVTSQDSFVYESFRYHPFGFIRKDYMEDELERVLREANEQWKRNRNRYTFRCDNKTVSLFLQDILYMEAKGNYLEIHAKEEIYRIRETMAAVQNELASCGFVRIHKGFLVNQQEVYTVGADTCSLTDGTILPIGRSYREQARETLMRYMMS